MLELVNLLIEKLMEIGLMLSGKLGKESMEKYI